VRVSPWTGNVSELLVLSLSTDAWAVHGVENAWVTSHAVGLGPLVCPWESLGEEEAVAVATVQRTL